MKLSSILFFMIVQMITQQCIQGMEGSSPSSNDTVPMKNVFERVLGITEQQFKDKYRWNNKDGYLEAFNDQSCEEIKKKIIANNDSKLFSLIAQGTLTFPTIQQLRNESTQRGPGSFEVLIYNSLEDAKLDIRTLMASAQNNKAAFQIASTPACMEAESWKPQNDLVSMTAMPVQGELAAIATAPAACWRKYFEPTCNKEYRENRDIYLWHRVFENNKEIAVEDVRRLIEINRSIPLSYARDESKYGQSFKGKNFENIDDFKIGIHRDVCVTTGYGGTTQNSPQIIVDNPQKQNVHLLLTSALNLVKLQTSKSLEPGLESFAKAALKASYEGSIRAAMSVGASVLYLTLVGGGSFRNHISWIAQAIEAQEELIKTSGLKIKLIYRPDKKRPLPVRTADTDTDFLMRLYALVKRVNDGNSNTDSSNAIKTSDIARSIFQKYTQEAYENPANKISVVYWAREVQRVFDTIASPPLSIGTINSALDTRLKKGKGSPFKPIARQIISQRYESNSSSNKAPALNLSPNENQPIASLSGKRSFSSRISSWWTSLKQWLGRK